MDAFNIAGNGWAEIFGLTISILLGYLLGKVFVFVCKRIAAGLEKSGRDYAAITFAAIAKASVLIFLSIGVHVGLLFLQLGAAEALLFKLSEIFITISVAYALFLMVEIPARFFLRMAAKTDSKLDDMLVGVVQKTLRLTIIILTIVQIAQILSGQELSTILAGLGIGGLAVALAAQDTIKNFFGSLIILADKPFELGERIVFDGHDGTIEDVGLRSTRLRRLDGNLVTIPNGELANKPIHNPGRRPSIRRILNLTLTYDTPPAKVMEAKQIVQDLLRDHEGMRQDFPPRVYFNEFNAASLNLFVIYWYFPADWWAYNDFSEKLNMAILTRFNEAGIDFAFPTQTLHLAGDNHRPLQVGVQLIGEDGTAFSPPS